MESLVTIAHVEVAPKVFDQLAGDLFKRNCVWIKVDEYEATPLGNFGLRQTRVCLLPHLRKIPFSGQLNEFTVEVPTPPMKWAPE